MSLFLEIFFFFADRRWSVVMEQLDIVVHTWFGEELIFIHQFPRKEKKKKGATKWAFSHFVGFFAAGIHVEKAKRRFELILHVISRFFPRLFVIQFGSLSLPRK